MDAIRRAVLGDENPGRRRSSRRRLTLRRRISAHIDDEPETGRNLRGSERFAEYNNWRQSIGNDPKWDELLQKITAEDNRMKQAKEKKREERINALFEKMMPQIDIPSAISSPSSSSITSISALERDASNNFLNLTSNGISSAQKVNDKEPQPVIEEPEDDSSLHEDEAEEEEEAEAEAEFEHDDHESEDDEIEKTLRENSEERNDGESEAEEEKVNDEEEMEEEEAEETLQGGQQIELELSHQEEKSNHGQTQDEDLIDRDDPSDELEEQDEPEVDLSENDQPTEKKSSPILETPKASNRLKTSTPASKASNKSQHKTPEDQVKESRRSSLRSSNSAKKVSIASTPSPILSRQQDGTPNLNDSNSSRRRSVMDSASKGLDGGRQSTPRPSGGSSHRSSLNRSTARKLSVSTPSSPATPHNTSRRSSVRIQEKVIEEDSEVGAEIESNTELELEAEKDNEEERQGEVEVEDDQARKKLSPIPEEENEATEEDHVEDAIARSPQSHTPVKRKRSDSGPSESVGAAPKVPKVSPPKASQSKIPRLKKLPTKNMPPPALSSDDSSTSMNLRGGNASSVASPSRMSMSAHETSEKLNRTFEVKRGENLSAVGDFEAVDENEESLRDDMSQPMHPSEPQEMEPVDDHEEEPAIDGAEENEEPAPMESSLKENASPPSVSGIQSEAGVSPVVEDEAPPPKQKPARKPRKKAALSDIANLASQATEDPSAPRYPRRNRIKPVVFWRGEKPIYRRTRDPVTNVVVCEFDHVQAGAQAFEPVLSHNRPKKSANSKGSNKRQKESDDDDLQVPSKVVKRDPFDLTINASPSLKANSMNDYEMNELSEKKMVMRLDQLEWKPSECNQGVFMALIKRDKVSKRCEGSMKMESKSFKRPQRAGNYETNYRVIYGAVAINIGRTVIDCDNAKSIILKTGDYFLVPEHTFYSIRNLRTDTAFLSFNINSNPANSH